MSHKHIRIETDADDFIHLEGSTDYTICGLDICGDVSQGIKPGKSTASKIDCPECIRIIRQCQAVKQTEIVSR